MTQSRTIKTLILSSGKVLTGLSELIVFAVLSRLLTLHDYATYRQTMLSYSFIAPVLMLGLPEALYYFIPNEKERARGILIENLVLLSLFGLIFSLFILLGGNQLLAWRFNNPSLSDSLLILSPYPLFMLPAAALTACLMAQGQVKTVAIFNVLSRLVMLVAVLTASLIWRTPVAAIIGVVVASAIVLIPSIKLMLDATTGSSTLISKSGMLLQAKFSVPLGFASMFGTLALSLNSIIVSSMCPPDQFAIYTNGAFEIPLIGIITGSVTSVLIPDLTKHFRYGEREEALDLWKRGATKCAIIIFPAIVFLFVMAPEVISLIFSSKYSGSVIPFRYYLLLLPIRIVTFGAIIMAAGKSNWVLYRSIGDLIVNAILCIIMVKLFGFIGAIIALLITTYIWTVPFNSYVISKECRCSYKDLYPLKDLTKILAISLVASMVLFVSSFISHFDVIYRLSITAVLYMFFVVLLFDKFKILDCKALISRNITF